MNGRLCSALPQMLHPPESFDKINRRISARQPATASRCSNLSSRYRTLFLIFSEVSRVIGGFPPDFSFKG